MQLIKPDGNNVTLENKEITLKEINKLLNGYADCERTKDHVIFVDIDGTYNKSAVNKAFNDFVFVNAKNDLIIRFGNTPMYGIILVMTTEEYKQYFKQELE